MISITTLILIVFIFALYMLVTLTMIPRVRKLLKIVLYMLVFVGLIIPEFRAIGDIKINIETYAIILAGIEVFEMIFKYIVEEQESKGKIVKAKIKRIYDNM